MNNIADSYWETQYRRSVIDSAFHRFNIKLWCMNCCHSLVCWNWIFPQSISTVSSCVIWCVFLFFIFFISLTFALSLSQSPLSFHYFHSSLCNIIWMQFVFTFDILNIGYASYLAPSHHSFSLSILLFLCILTYLLTLLNLNIINAEHKNERRKKNMNNKFKCNTQFLYVRHYI